MPQASASLAVSPVRRAEGTELLLRPPPKFGRAGAEADQDGALAMFETAARLVPSLKGAVGPHPDGWVKAGEDNRTSLLRLHDGLAAAHPEAGRTYWTVRSWTMLTWQPVIFGTIAVHLHSALPRLGEMSQCVGEAVVSGFRVPSAAAEIGEPKDLIAGAGRQLRALSDVLLADLNRVARMKEEVARRLLADRVLGSLILLRTVLPGLENAKLRNYGLSWLSAMQLEGMSALASVALAEGGEELALRRRACCLDYLRSGGGLCASCPKHVPHARPGRRRKREESHA
jgi:siderophore ferric iron reductase